MEHLSQGLEVQVPDVITPTTVRQMAALSGQHPDYARLAGRMAVSILHTQTPASFSEAMDLLQEIIAPSTQAIIHRNRAQLDAMVRPDRDMTFDIFG